MIKARPPRLACRLARVRRAGGGGDIGHLRLDAAGRHPLELRRCRHRRLRRHHARERPRHAWALADIVITVRGPSGPVDVREKARRALIWINNEKKRSPDAPSISPSPRPGLVDPDRRRGNDRRLSLRRSTRRSTPRAPAPPGLRDRPFRDALLRLKGNEGLYLAKEDGVVPQRRPVPRHHPAAGQCAARHLPGRDAPVDRRKGRDWAAPRSK